MPNKLNASQLAKIAAETAVDESCARSQRMLLNHIKALDEEIRTLWIGVTTANHAFESIHQENRSLKATLKLALAQSGWKPVE